MKKLLILSLLFVGSLGTADLIPIKRNQLWNQAVLEMQSQEQSLRIVEKFLKENELNLKPEILDYQVIKNLDKAIDSNERITRGLKDLKKSLEVGR